MRDIAPFGPRRCQAVDALGVAAVDQNHVGDTVANLVERPPDIVGEGQRVSFGGMTYATAGEYDRCAFGHRRAALGLGPGTQEIAPLDQRGREHRTVVEARAGHWLPGRTELVEVEGSRNLTHLLKRQHRAFGALRTLDLGFELMGVDLGSIGRRNERPDLVRGAVERGGFACRGPVKEIDESPAQILGIGLERGPGDEREEIGPDRLERLDDFQQTLDKFAVPTEEQAELKAIVNSTRSDIVVASGAAVA